MHHHAAAKTAPVPQIQTVTISVDGNNAVAVVKGEYNIGEEVCFANAEKTWTLTLKFEHEEVYRRQYLELKPGQTVSLPVFAGGMSTKYEVLKHLPFRKRVTGDPKGSPDPPG